MRHFSYRIRPFVFFLATATAALCLKASETDIIRATEETGYRAVHKVFVPHDGSRYALEISANLEDWEGHELTFDANSISWKIDSESGDISLVSQKESKDGTWTIEIELPSGLELYSRITEIDEAE